jgi:hypothetical protein
MFLGGFAAAKVAGPITRLGGAIHGAVQAEQAGSAALQAEETTGKGLVGLFFAMLLGLVAAVAGTMLGMTRAQLAVAERAGERAERLIRHHA